MYFTMDIENFHLEDDEFPPLLKSVEQYEIIVMIWE